MGGKPDAKTCPHCGEIKPATEFHNNKRRHDGLACWCKMCIKEYAAVWNRKPEVKARAATRALAKYHALSADERREWNRTGGGRKADRLMRMYHLSMADYDAMLAAQGNRCAICGASADERLMAVDHDHSCCPTPRSCGRCVRAILCSSCNRRLGVLENAEWVAAARTYLDYEIARLESERP